ncbi:MAG TPA: cytidylate kinase family protein, partial [Thermodesulfovibrionales bacterium]|nr:cytidylate kinase family protein [Thermodesulfovibrionales bacterium]
MSIITIFSGSYCNEESVIKEILRRTGYKQITDREIVSKASSLSGISDSKILKAFSSKTSVFNQLTHDKECSIAFMKLALAETLAEDNILIYGFSSMLVPAGIAHVLRICLIAEMKYRISQAVSSGMSENESLKMIHKSDEDKASWTKSVLGKDDPWNTSSYDMVLTTDRTSPEDIAGLVEKVLEKDVLKSSVESQRAIQDFILAASVETALVKAGHIIAAESKAGAVTLTINKKVLLLKRLEEELQALALKIPGVQSVSTKVGKDFYQSDIYRKF